MNRRGQVTITFILLLPFLLLLFIFVIDTGLMYVEKRKVENNVKDVLRYGLKQENFDESITPKLEYLIKENIDRIKTLDIMVTNNTIRIHVITNNKTLFGVYLEKYFYEVDITYQGYVENERIKIIKE